jgi:hypothetical protein
MVETLKELPEPPTADAALPEGAADTTKRRSRPSAVRRKKPVEAAAPLHRQQPIPAAPLQSNALPICPPPLRQQWRPRPPLRQLRLLTHTATSLAAWATATCWTPTHWKHRSHDQHRARPVEWRNFAGIAGDGLSGLDGAPGGLARQAVSTGSQGARKAMRLGAYALSSAVTGNAEPCIKPLPGDHRFDHPGWERFPYNVVYQGFLLNQQWWHNATTGIRGVSKHGEAAVWFTAKQILDMTAPCNMSPS